MAETKLDLATLTYVIEDKKYQINPEGHLPKVANIIMAEAKRYEKTFTESMKGEVGESVRLENQRASSKIILEVGLVNFKYDDAINIHGYGILDQVATELYRFLVVGGGKAGVLHSLQQLGVIPNTSNGSHPE